jgi:NAD(P)-dependent dehydrogenase (short-subunit alcohol dehydrogenase family)
MTTGYDLDGKVAIVTGASRGVGASVARCLAAGGGRVACAARSTTAAPQRTPGTLDDTVASIEAAGGTALAVPTNLARAEDVEAMLARTVEVYGRLDILVNNAAVTFVGDVDISLTRHDLVMEINLRAPFLAARAAIPHMRSAGGGRILNVSSLAALVPVPGLMSYGVSKIGLERLTVDLARQLDGDGIAVNCFRIDVAVASEGFIANTPGVDRSGWEPCEVPAEGILWMLRQPVDYTGRRESMFHLRAREGIMGSKAERPANAPTPTTLIEGLHKNDDNLFVDPYADAAPAR